LKEKKKKKKEEKKEKKGREIITSYELEGAEF
jgi:hypothetical protein